jgi:hypothetical protein
MNALLLVLAALQAQPPLDEGTFIVRRDTGEIAREQFRLVAGRLDGWSLGASARYDHGHPLAVLTPILTLGPDSAPLTLQFDVADPNQQVRILGQAGRGRFTLRYLAHGSERARELPAAGGANTVVLDDSVFSLYTFVAWRARKDPVTLTAIFPRGARRETLTVQDRGPEATVLNRDAATLRHLVVTGGSAGAVDLWLDPQGRLMKLQFPDRHLVVERLPAS